MQAIAWNPRPAVPPHLFFPAVSLPLLPLVYGLTVIPISFAFAQNTLAECSHMHTGMLRMKKWILSQFRWHKPSFFPSPSRPHHHPEHWEQTLPPYYASAREETCSKIVVIIDLLLPVWMMMMMCRVALLSLPRQPRPPSRPKDPIR